MLNHYDLLKKLKPNVAKLNALSPEPVFGITDVHYAETVKRDTRSVSLQFERNPICALCSTREMSRIEYEHPGNFLLDTVQVEGE